MADDGRSGPRAGDLFQLLRDGKAWTRAELATTTGLARSTVAGKVDLLLSSGLVVSVGEASSSGGRPPSRFAFHAEARTVLAVDVGASHVRVALTDLNGEVLAEERELMPVAAGPEAVLGYVIESAERLLAATHHPESLLAGVGIGLPGPVEHATGRPVKPPIMPGWDGFDVVGFVQQSLRVPVLVDNDVNIMALGERAGFWPDVDDLLFIKLATGIGSGIISSGHLQRGADGTAGDLGHVRVARGDGVVCRCGNVGCLEALASGDAVAHSLAEQGVDAPNGATVVELASHGNSAAIQSLRQAGRDIGEVLATCVNLLNPSVIVIGGSMAAAGEHIMAGVREVVYRRSPPLATTNLRIVLSRAGERAAVMGASQLVSQHVLSPAGIEAALLSMATAG
ncbi:ROK family transcriptional regulator [Sinomonas humi]|uniref:ROK family transcriptional regulator n=1 Tax=Sinomonas humi TaxID=1338436 RepID=A0A0B2ANI7_9MICC|nr:ROK family protein [Sinomonas humi]KHL03507.1 ROK family transcriptional regulator [Sinomonas humi]